MIENIKVVVIVDGYAGLVAANRLTQRDDVTVDEVRARPSAPAGGRDRQRDRRPGRPGRRRPVGGRPPQAPDRRGRASALASGGAARTAPEPFIEPRASP
jgi:hypothetical protein